MNNYNKYTSQNIRDMNTSYPWRSQPIEIKEIKSTSQKNKTALKSNYILHATGDADLHGRKYVALPSNIILDDKTKKKYNLM